MDPPDNKFAASVCLNLSMELVTPLVYKLVEGNKLEVVEMVA